MGNNVIIFGAGASHMAGVPTLDTFVEKLKDYAFRGVDDNREALSENDIKIFERARAVTNELNEYHTQASFDNLNLEDLLSILSFRTFGKDNSGEKNLEAMVDAIVRTIELSCEVKHDGRLRAPQQAGSEIYRSFWMRIFRAWKTHNINPIIITLNYDLVLERSLFQSLITTDGLHSAYPFDGIVLDYKYDYLPRFSYKIELREWSRDTGASGTALATCTEDDLEKPIVIEILKLHGSINFPSTGRVQSSDAPTKAVEKPLLIPPIANKPIIDQMSGIWNSALAHLGEAKNLVIVGYSLPRSDVYMQFFLKTALGRNNDLRRLFVFNPTLYHKDKEAEEMEERYSRCFSEQLRKRITYRPKPAYEGGLNDGSFEQFVELLDLEARYLFF